jgi:hypothetical protein
MKSFIDTHVAGGGGSVVGREDVAAERSRDDNQHEKLFVVLDRLEDNEFVVDKRDAVLANVVAVGRMKGADVGPGEGGTSKEVSVEEGTVGVLVVSSGPVERSRDGAGTDGSSEGSEAASDKAGRGLSQV